MTNADPAIARAREQLASELGCAPETISVISTEAVDWRDSSLGCPRPGMMYLMVITPGYRITLEHDGRRYTFHTDQGRRAIRCDQPQHRHGGEIM